MPNYAQAAIQIRQKKEREAKERELKAELESRRLKGQTGPLLGQPQIPVGPGGVRQFPGQTGRQRRRVEHGLRPNPDGNFEGGGSANVILYVGLGMIAIGLVITFVGLGDKGFKTLELKLIGPSLVGCGVFFALLRILFCTVPSCCRSCIKRWKKTEESEKLLAKEAEEKLAAGLGGNQSIQRNGVVRPHSLPQGGRGVGHPRGQQWTGGVAEGVNISNRVVRPTAPSNQHPHFISDSEEDVDLALVPKTKVRERPPKKSLGNGGKSFMRHEGRRSEVIDNYSTDSSSTFSLAEGGFGTEIALRPPHLGGSTKNLRTGDIILNATKLHVEAT